MSSGLSKDDLRVYTKALHKDPCAYCNEPSAVLDHVTARSHGGSNHWENYVGACERCNKRKNYAPLLVFLARRQIHDEKARVQADLDAWNSVIPGGTKRHAFQKDA